jgi:hypothetical protein
MIMPVSVSVYVRTSPSDSTFGVPGPVEPLDSFLAADVPWPKGDYRFAPVRLKTDENGHIIVTYPPYRQPAVFSRRATSVATIDLRAP